MSKLKVCDRFHEKCNILHHQILLPFLSRDVKDCKQCKNKLLEFFTLPCTHNVCKRCVNQLQEAGDYGCPICKKDYGETTELKECSEAQYVQQQ